MRDTCLSSVNWLQMHFVLFYTSLRKKVVEVNGIMFVLSTPVLGDMCKLE